VSRSLWCVQLFCGSSGEGFLWFSVVMGLWVMSCLSRVELFLLRGMSVFFGVVGLSWMRGGCWLCLVFLSLSVDVGISCACDCCGWGLV